MSEARSGFAQDYAAFVAGGGNIASAVPDPSAPPADPSLDPAPAPPPAAPPAPAAPAPAPVPDPAVPPPATAAPPAPPAAPPTPAAPIQIDTTTLSPEAKRFLEMFNGDIATALSKGLEYNNRLGKNGEAGQPTTPQDPNDPTAPPDGPMQVSAQEFNQAVVTFTRTDPQCRQLDRKYTPIVLELEGPDPANGQTGLDARVEQLRGDVAFASRYAELPAIKQDEFQSREAMENLRALRAELTTAEGRQWMLTQQRADLQRQWLARREAYVNHLNGQIAERQEAYHQAQVSARDRAVAEQSLRTAWKPALEAAMAQHNIPAELYEHFDRTVRMTALANNDAGLLVEDAAAFALEQAVQYAQMLDTHHRTKSREYAQASVHRTGQTTDAGPVSVVPPQEQVPSGSDSLEARLAAARRGLRQDWAGR